MAYMEEEKNDKIEDENRTARTQERQDADTAISTAFMKVDEINNDSTNADLESAQEAIDAAKTIIEMATHLPEDERMRRLALVDDYQESFNDKKKMAMDAMKKKEDDMKMATTKAAMDLYNALGAPHGSSNLTALDNTFSTEPIKFNEGKLTIRISENAGGNENFSAQEHNLSPMPEVDVSSAALDGWTGTKYGLTDKDAKAEYESVVYTNRGEPTKQAFLTWATGAGFTEVSPADPLTALGLPVAIDFDESDDEDLKYIESEIFKHSGAKTHTLENNIVDGSFNGVSGQFRCDANCISYGKGENSSTPAGLEGTWTFYPSTDGMIDIPDPNYLIYGWWVRKDMDGMPTAASAFYNTVGTKPTTLWSSNTTGNNITGSATYTGKAVGKFAIHDPFNAELNNSGHFTADAELKADFEEANSVTGTIDNFLLNDGESDAPNWSVSLNESTDWTAGGGVEGGTTTWSVNGVESAPGAGTWTADMFDHTLDDDIDFPTTAIGEFYSEIDSRYRMVGSFAAEIEE